MIKTIATFLIVAVPLNFLIWLKKNPEQMGIVKGIISRNIYDAAQQRMHLTAFGVRLIILVFVYFAVPVTVLVIFGGR